MKLENVGSRVFNAKTVFPFSARNSCCFFTMSDGKLKRSDKYMLPKKRIILMPQALTKDKLLEKSKWLEEFAKTNDFNFSTRLQVLLWDNQRGK